jgi:hypothetical protein
MPDHIRSIAGCLARFQDEIYISEKNLGILMGKSRRRAGDGMRWLKDNGWLLQTQSGWNAGKKNVTNKYVRSVPEHAAWVWSWEGTPGELHLAPSCSEDREETNRKERTTGRERHLVEDKQVTLVTQPSDVGDIPSDVGDTTKCHQRPPKSIYRRAEIEKHSSDATGNAGGTAEERVSKPKPPLPGSFALDRLREYFGPGENAPSSPPGQMIPRAGSHSAAVAAVSVDLADDLADTDIEALLASESVAA